MNPWDNVLKKCKRPMDVLRITYPKMMDGIITYEQAQQIMKYAFKLHPEWKEVKKISTKYPWEMEDENLK